MPYRNIPLVTGEFYHIFNRSIGKMPIFIRTRDLNRILEVCRFYIFRETKIRFSHFNRLHPNEKSEYLDRLQRNSPRQVEILAFCFMPNHYHFLVRQLEENGISTLIRKIQDSYAKYFNMKYKRTGSLFQANFKAVRIDGDEQLLHLCRYIHLNPLTSYLIRDIDSLKNYNWCSYASYMNIKDDGFLNKQIIISFFKNINSFKEFNTDQIDYQRKLGRIKHLLIEFK